MDDIFLTRVTVRTEHMAHVTVLGTVEGSGQAGTYYCQTQSVHKSPLARNQILLAFYLHPRTSTPVFSSNIIACTKCFPVK